VWFAGSNFPLNVPPTIGHGLEFTVSTTRGRLAPAVTGASAGIAAHRLTPRIATLSPKIP
jgi:hypothetical protein